MRETQSKAETELRWSKGSISYCRESREARDWASGRWLDGSRIKHITQRLGEPTTWGRS